MSKLQEQVREFHEAMGQPTLSTPTVPSAERVRLRVALVCEEFLELLDALGHKTLRGEPELLRDSVRLTVEHMTMPVDMVRVADALADLDYVVQGTRAEFGIDGGPIADEVHRSNLSKLGADGKPVIREDGKITKGPNYSPPDIAGELRKQGWEP